MTDNLMVNYGTLVSAKTKKGEPYTDWRSMYLDWPGLIVVRASETMPGKKLVLLFPSAPDEAEQPYFETSRGDITAGDDSFVIETEHSVYEFTINDGCLPEDEKEELFLNVMSSDLLP